MNQITLLSDAPTVSDPVIRALALLAELGPEVVDRCLGQCEICGRVLDAAA